MKRMCPSRAIILKIFPFLDASKFLKPNPDPEPDAEDKLTLRERLHKEAKCPELPWQMGFRMFSDPILPCKQSLQMHIDSCMGPRDPQVALKKLVQSVALRISAWALSSYPIACPKKQKKFFFVDSSGVREYSRPFRIPIAAAQALGRTSDCIKTCLKRVKMFA